MGALSKRGRIKEREGVKEEDCDGEREEVKRKTQWIGRVENEQGKKRGEKKEKKKRKERKRLVCHFRRITLFLPLFIHPRPKLDLACPGVPGR